MSVKNITLIACLLISISGFSQVIKYKAFQTKITIFLDEEHKHELKSNKRNGEDILVVVNLDKGYIRTYGEKENQVDFTELISSEKDGDKGIFNKWSGVDSDGEECIIYLYVYKKDDGSHLESADLIIKKGKFLEMIFRLKET